MPRREDNIAELIRLYVDEGLSLQQIGERIGRTRQAVHLRLKRAGVKLRPGGTRRYTIEREVLHQLCEVEGLSVAKVSAKLGCGWKIVEREMVRHGIERPNKKQGSKEIDRHLLYQVYVVDRLTQAEAAAYFGVGIATVQTELKRHGITFRHAPGQPYSERIDRAVLKHLYVVEALSLAAIGKQLGVSPYVVGEELKRHSIPRRERSRRVPQFERDLLYRLYVVERMPLKQVGETLGVSYTTVGKQLKQHGITTRRSRLRPPRFGKELLYDLYVTKGLSSIKIAEKLGVDENTILRNLARHDITRREAGWPAAKK